MGNCEVEYRLARRAWVMADEWVRQDLEPEPEAAVRAACEAVFLPNGATNPSWEFIGKRMFETVHDLVGRSERPVDEQRAAGRSTARLLEAVVPTWGRQRPCVHPDFDPGVFLS
jgi:hypothetical protein